MRTSTRRGLLLTLATSALLLPATAASAAPDQAETRSGKPSHSQWISDVTQTTQQASGYLATRPAIPGEKTAIVLDIDNTALETGYCWWVTCPATSPVLELALQAKASGSAVFFVTARYKVLGGISAYNLRDVGYPVDGLVTRFALDPDSYETVKTNARISIEENGYTIIANIGNSDSDLAGGHAERTFKLPDYDGALS